jgi:hypothetical protein
MMEFVIYLLKIMSKESEGFSNVDISVLLKTLILIIKYMFFFLFKKPTTFFSLKTQKF